VEHDVAVTGDASILDPGFIDPERGYGQHLMRLAPAWRVTKGNPKIVIAVIDSGINPNHPEFSGRLVEGYDFINGDPDPTDDHGHGTHVAGIAAAGLNGLGTVGSCPQCKIMAIKVLNQRNGGTWSSVSKGILYAVDHGARVINLSLGATISSSTLEAAVQYAYEHDVIVVAAAGNMGANFEFFPAALPHVFAVSGTDRNDQRWIVSSYGNYVDVSAPAVSIYSAYNDLAHTTGYAYMSGTSMASPFVAGLAGLVLSRKPQLHADQVTELIEQTTTDLGAKGKDVYYGHGRVDAYRALVAANDGVTPAPDDPDDDDTKTHSIYLPVLSTALTPSN
jgi:type VII secretion-associated serine protease mycosin